LPLSNRAAITTFQRLKLAENSTTQSDFKLSRVRFLAARRLEPKNVVHFHVRAVDGVFDEVAVAVQGESNAQSLPPRIALHPASAVDETAVAHLPADLRCRILRSFVGRALIARVDANAMLANPHSRFWVAAGVRIETDDRAALVPLSRYCARPPFAMDLTGHKSSQQTGIQWRKPLPTMRWIGTSIGDRAKR